MGACRMPGGEGDRSEAQGSPYADTVLVSAAIVLTDLKESIRSLHRNPIRIPSEDAPWILDPCTLSFYFLAGTPGEFTHEKPTATRGAAPALVASTHREILPAALHGHRQPRGSGGVLH